MVLITRADLSSGYQVVQPAHALAEFAITYPRKFKDWMEVGKNLVVLSTTNEKQLLKLADQFEEKGLDYVLFREPDIGNKATAIAVEPNEEAYKLTSQLPLTLKECKQENERIVFHFNKAHNQDQTIPPWVIKHKGTSHYVNHMESSRGFSTKETPDNEHTKAAIQFKGRLEIKEGTAYIS